MSITRTPARDGQLERLRFLADVRAPWHRIARAFVRGEAETRIEQIARYGEADEAVSAEYRRQAVAILGRDEAELRRAAMALRRVDLIAGDAETAPELLSDDLDAVEAGIRLAICYPEEGALALRDLKAGRIDKAAIEAMIAERSAALAAEDGPASPPRGPGR